MGNENILQCDTWFHASKVMDLDKQGIKVNQKPSVCYKPIPFLYLGTLEYIFNQYFEYAPKGTYQIYKVSLPKDVYVEHLTEGQIRLRRNIPPSQVEKYDVAQI